jgi:hypothetical protein
LLAPCCLFGCAIVAWAITALGALLFVADRRKDAAPVEDVLTIGFIACVLVVTLHIAPDGVAMALAAAMALHALLIAALVLVDFAKTPSRAPSQWPPRAANRSPEQQRD